MKGRSFDKEICACLYRDARRINPAICFITKRSERNESVLSFSIRQLADGKIGVNTRYEYLYITMNQKKIVAGILFAVVLAIAGVFVWEKQTIIEQSNQEQPKQEITNVNDIKNADSVESIEFSPQQIVAIPNSTNVWYEVPELGIKLLLSKAAAEEIVYQYRSINDIGNDVTKRVASVSFFSKKIITFDVALGLPKTWDDLYIMQKYLGTYTGETFCCGVKFFKQLDGFYLTDGGSPQGLSYSEEEQRRFDETVAPLLPQFPRLMEIQIQGL